MNVALAEKISGWMSIGELRFLAEQASKVNLIVEAGCFKGRSTRAMADNTKGVIHAIDPWDGKYEGLRHPGDLALQELQTYPDDIRKEFYLNLFDYIVEKKLIMHRMNFHDFRIDNPELIFIDANHDYITTKRDIIHGLDLLCNGGLLCGHDYRGEWPGVIQAVDEIFGRGVRTCETIWWIKL